MQRRNPSRSSTCPAIFTESRSSPSSFSCSSFASSIRTPQSRLALNPGSLHLAVLRRRDPLSHKSCPPPQQRRLVIAAQRLLPQPLNHRPPPTLVQQLRRHHALGGNHAAGSPLG